MMSQQERSLPPQCQQGTMTMISKAFHSLHLIAVLAVLDHWADGIEAWTYISQSHLYAALRSHLSF